MMKKSDGISLELSVQIIVILQNEGNTSSQKLLLEYQCILFYHLFHNTRQHTVSSDDTKGLWLDLLTIVITFQMIKIT